MKNFIKILCILAVLMLSGCGSFKVAMIDYVQTNPCTDQKQPIMETDAGYYYNDILNGNMKLQFFDKESKQTIFLCNKPECEHDGSEYCAATNSSYRIICTGMYDNYIYINVNKDEGQTHLRQLLRAKLDGTELSVVATYNKYTGTYNPYASSQMILHRGKAFISYILPGDRIVSESEETISDSLYSTHGFVMIDLSTGKSETVFECSLGEKEYLKKFNAYGDYIYYTIRIGHKTSLCRCNYLTGDTETMDLLANFKGQYTVIDDHTLCYLRDEIYTYNIDTGESELFINPCYDYTDTNRLLTTTYHYTPSQIQCYNNYLLANEYFTYQSSDTSTQPYPCDSYVYHIYSMDGDEVSSFYIYHNNQYGGPSINIVNDTIYYSDLETLSKCSFSDALAGNAVWSKVLTFE